MKGVYGFFWMPHWNKQMPDILNLDSFKEPTKINEKVTDKQIENKKKSVGID